MELNYIEWTHSLEHYAWYYTYVITANLVIQVDLAYLDVHI